MGRVQLAPHLGSSQTPVAAATSRRKLQQTAGAQPQVQPQAAKPGQQKVARPQTVTIMRVTRGGDVFTST
jgi:hypothetical protein